MVYRLINAKESDITKLMEYKLHSILDFVDQESKTEIDKIKVYVKNQIPLQLKQYQMIELENKIIGCLLVENKEDGKLLNEIYIEEEYRNKGIGTHLLQQILSKQTVYLWVYKINTKAIALYTRLGFHIIKQTKTRYYMKYSD